MAKLAKSSETRKLVDSIKAMERGNYASPVYQTRREDLKAVSAHLEALRRKLLIFTEEAGMREAKYYSALSDVVHDLKSPLQVLIGYAECLSDGMFDRDYVKLISDKCLEMNDIVLNIISEAKKKVTGGKFEVVSVKEFFPEAILKSAAPVTEKNIRLKVSKSPRATVYIDKTAFESVVQNLLSNAAKFTPKHGKIRVRMSAGKRYFKFSVRDNGKGIPPEDLDKIFDRYYTTDLKSGSGVGLAAVRETVTAHHGFVYAPKRKKGALFVVKIPRYSIEKEMTTLAARARRLHLFMILGYIFLPFGILYSLFRIMITSSEISREKKLLLKSDPDEILKSSLRKQKSKGKKA